MSSTPTTSSEPSSSATKGTVTVVAGSSVAFTSIVSGRHRTLMESLLARKIEAAAASGVNMPSDRRLIRTDSLESTSSLGSISSVPYGDDVCRCDDCLLGIADLYTITCETEIALAKKKVTLSKVS